MPKPRDPVSFISVLSSTCKLNNERTLKLTLLFAFFWNTLLFKRKLFPESRSVVIFQQLKPPSLRNLSNEKLLIKIAINILKQIQVQQMKWLFHGVKNIIFMKMISFLIFNTGLLLIYIFELF